MFHLPRSEGFRIDGVLGIGGRPAAPTDPLAASTKMPGVRSIPRAFQDWCCMPACGLCNSGQKDSPASLAVQITGEDPAGLYSNVAALLLLLLSRGAHHSLPEQSFL